MILESKVTVQPLLEPIDRDAIAKLDLKVDGTTENDLLDILIPAARQLVELETGLSLITQTRTIQYDCFPTIMELPNGPVQSVTSIQYYDTAGDLTTFDSSLYYVDTHPTLARVKVKASWPGIQDRPGAIIVTYVTGFGTTAASVPPDLRKAVLVTLGWMYENRDQALPKDLVRSVIPTRIQYVNATY